MNQPYLFIQMSGVPGSGKTTVANAIAKHIGAVVVDHDVTKSALLNPAISVSNPGHASYLVLDAIARSLLQQGFSVIFDSPCFYDDLLKRGQTLAAEAGATYAYIECVLNDLTQLDQRLRHRVETDTNYPSQVTSVYGALENRADGSGKAAINADVFRDWIANMKRPDSAYCVLDTSQPVDACINNALTYLQSL